MRVNNKQIAEELVNIIESGSYTSMRNGKRIQVKIECTNPAELKTSEDLDKLNFEEKGSCNSIEVTKNSAVDDIFRTSREHPDKVIGVLNFASAYNPGGGFITGAIAQEEGLCHASTLYVQLRDCKELYRLNKQANKDIYTDNMAVSQTEFIKNTHGILVPNPVKTIVVTSAAVNNNKVQDPNSLRIEAAMRTRMHKIIQLFIENNCNILILGAFGCGVFKNDPHIIAEIWKEELSKHGGYFDKVIF